VILVAARLHATLKHGEALGSRILPVVESMGEAASAGDQAQTGHAVQFEIIGRIVGVAPLARGREIRELTRLRR
jgi:hypothetical protein